MSKCIGGGRRLGSPKAQRIPLDAIPDPRNLCARCQRVCAVEFALPPSAWDAVSGEHRYEHLCITCWAEMAGDIRWAGDIRLTVIDATGWAVGMVPEEPGP